MTGKPTARYKVMEINGNRAVIEFICQLLIPPQSVANIDELELVEIGNNNEKKIA